MSPGQAQHVSSFEFQTNRTFHKFYLDRIQALWHSKSFTKDLSSLLIHFSWQRMIRYDSPGIIPHGIVHTVVRQRLTHFTRNQNFENLSIFGVSIFDISIFDRIFPNLVEKLTFLNVDILIYWKITMLFLILTKLWYFDQPKNKEFQKFREIWENMSVFGVSIFSVPLYMWFLVKTVILSWIPAPEILSKIPLKTFKLHLFCL